MRYVKFGENWYKVEESYTDNKASKVYANINKALYTLDQVRDIYRFDNMNINIEQTRKITDAMRKLSALLSLPVEIPRLAPDVKTYTITVRVFGDYEDSVPVSVYPTEEEQKEGFNDLISDDNFGLLEDIDWGKEEIIRLYQNMGLMYLRVPVTAKFTFSIQGENLSPEEIREKAIERFEVADFGQLSGADIEDIILISEE